MCTVFPLQKKRGELSVKRPAGWRGKLLVQVEEAGDVLAEDEPSRALSLRQKDSSAKRKEELTSRGEISFPSSMNQMSSYCLLRRRLLYAYILV